MATTLCCDVLKRLEGKTLVTAESLTGGGIGNALTAVSGASAVYKGGVISYVNEVERDVLGVPQEILDRYGAVSAWTALTAAVQHPHSICMAVPLPATTPATAVVAYW